MNRSPKQRPYGETKVFVYHYRFDGQDLAEFLGDRYQIKGTQLETYLNCRIKINQKTPLVGQRLERGDTLAYTHRREDEAHLIPGELSVLYEDENLLAISKPPGVPVSPSGQYYFNALAIYAREYFGSVELSPLHRLDLETSGVLLFGKHKPARQRYQKMFANQEFDKRYSALTWANPGLKPITGAMVPAKDSAIYTKLNLEPSSEPNSHTEILSVKPWGDYWLVCLKPITGKTNQLRVHLAHQGAPIVGDKKYHFEEAVYLDWFEHRDFSRLKAQLILPRQALHCDSISFVDPFSFETRTIQDHTPHFNNLIQPLKDP